MMPKTVFFSWQSDIKPAAACRTLIGEALEVATEQLGTGEVPEVVEPDRDTLGVPGTPDIRDTILSKIDGASVFVADVTPVNTAASGFRIMPNPNVLFELGYATKALGWERVILVFNKSFGDPDDLPFDLQGRRCECYESSATSPERAPARRTLTKQLRQRIADILKAAPRKSAFRFELDFRKESPSAGARHNYNLVLRITNDGHATSNDWLMTVDVPRAIVEGGHAYEVAGKGTETTRHFRFASKERGGPDNTLYPESSIERTVSYYILQPFRDTETPILASMIVATAYVNDALVDRIERPLAGLHRF